MVAESKPMTFVRRVWDHPANRGRRFRQLAGAVRYQVAARLGRSFVTPLGERSRILADRSHSYSSLVVYANPPDLAELRAWKRLLAPGDLFVDVGANIGAYTVLMAEHGCEVLAVEPDASARSMLISNLELNGYTARIFQGVLADAPGEIGFSIGFDATNRITSEGGLSVLATTFDRLVGERRVAGVKVDVEGAERLVLEGAHDALQQQRIGALQLEWNDASEKNFKESRQPVLALLRDAGYVTYRPSLTGELLAEPNPGLGRDVFALPRA